MGSLEGHLVELYPTVLYFRETLRWYTSTLYLLYEN